jgi:hypothetical protein
MTTREFIKMLQEADPSGNAHIRMSGGVPRFAELKPGYWDGPYSYIDEDGNWTYSTEGEKIDIWSLEIDDFVSEMIDSYQIPEWEEVKSKFKFKLEYSGPSSKEREDRILSIAKNAYDEYVKMHKKFESEGEERALLNAEKGWKWFQNKLVDDITLRPNNHHYYTWLIYDEDGKEHSSNVYNVEGVYKSGLFERLDNNVKPGYYEWIKK